ncbi:MAG: signal peptidase I [Verrucomicrobia bacterium]|nr:signal peptidase I [Verrucomicrobiota bacterium]MCF7708237.1 signal peptidase I [Verrucomicrobiota bacterium]
MIIRWFLSRNIRKVTSLRRHVKKLLNAQRDLLPGEAVTKLENVLDDARDKIRHADKPTVKAVMEDLENTANRLLKPYPSPFMRENVEVVLVAVVVAMAIRTFFIQPMKIPTGSMQPTLYGITSENIRNKPEVEIPGFFTRWFDKWFYGTSYYHLEAKLDGELTRIDPPETVLPFVKKQVFWVDGTPHTLWFPPDQSDPRYPITRRAGIEIGEFFEKGEDIIRLVMTAGDHLFVDRLTYNFRPPERGEIIIFQTRGVAPNMLPQNTFYIKRLIGMDGDRIRIANDQHVYLNGNRLDASTPHFQLVYSFPAKPKENGYFGHVNGLVGAFLTHSKIAPLFPNEKTVFTVRDDHYFVLGDNTLNSFDSRYWGDFPQEKLVGRSFFVYWPFNKRFGWNSLYY